jgi:hypothetical protein
MFSGAKRTQSELIKNMGRPRSNAIFEPPKKSKSPGILKQSVNDHKGFLKMLFGDEKAKQSDLNREAQEAGELPFIVPPRSRSLGASFDAHKGFVKMLFSSEKAKQSDLDRENEEAIKQGRKPFVVPPKSRSLKESVAAHSEFLSVVFGSNKNNKDEGKDKDQSESQNKPRAKSNRTFKLGFNFQSAKSKLMEKGKAFAQKLSESFKSKGGGKGFAFFKSLVGKSPGQHTVPQSNDIEMVDLSKSNKFIDGMTANKGPTNNPFSANLTAPNGAKPFTAKPPISGLNNPFKMGQSMTNVFNALLGKSEKSSAIPMKHSPSIATTTEAT